MAYLIASKDPKIPQDKAFTRRAIVYTKADRDLVVAAIRRAEPGTHVSAVESTRHKISD